MCYNFVYVTNLPVVDRTITMFSVKIFIGGTSTGIVLEDAEGLDNGTAFLNDRDRPQPISFPAKRPFPGPILSAPFRASL